VYEQKNRTELDGSKSYRSNRKRFAEVNCSLPQLNVVEQKQTERLPSEREKIKLPPLTVQKITPRKKVL
jgi:hypothetical protein